MTARRSTPAPPLAASQGSPRSRESQGSAPDTRAPGAVAVPDGEVRHVTAHGVPVFEATYRDGLRHGPCRLHDATGRLLQEAEYEDDLQHGTTTLYVDGQAVCSHQYRRGVLEGETLCYAASGAIRARLPYRDGRLHGKALFFQDDQLSRRACYRAGRLDGLCEDFDASGHPVQTANYRDGALHGPFVRYWPNGRKMEERLYQVGRGVVAARRFDPQGRATASEASHEAGNEAGSPPDTSAPRVEKWARGLERWVRG